MVAWAYLTTFLKDSVSTTSWVKSFPRPPTFLQSSKLSSDWPFCLMIFCIWNEYNVRFFYIWLWHLYLTHFYQTSMRYIIIVLPYWQGFKAFRLIKWNDEESNRLGPIPIYGKRDYPCNVIYYLEDFNKQ